ncbi:MAG: DegT/DnrJ/EryC1/StrS family aminotransferase, partial [Telluria sp.]
KVRRPVVPRECTHNAHMYYLLLPDQATRARVIERLKSRGVQTVFHYIPLHSSPVGRELGRAAGDMRHTDDAGERLLRLPLWLGLEDHLADVIAEIVAAVHEG